MSNERNINDSLQEDFKKWEEPNCGLDEIILNAFSKRKLVLFLGAGVSRLAGLPGWNELADTLIKKAFTKYSEQLEIFNNITNSKEKISIAHEEFKSINKLNEFYEYFGKALKPKDETKQAKIYRILEKFPITFVTTNADHLFEDELGGDVCYDELDVSKLFQEGVMGRHRLFYLHGRYEEGNIDHNENNLVFTSAQYVRKYNDSNTINFFKKIFNDPDNVVLFIGYGLNEFEIIDYIVTKTNYSPKNGSIQAYQLEGFCSNQSALYYARKQYFRSLNINLMPYCLDELGYEGLSNVLTKLLLVFNSQANVPYDDYTDIKSYTKQYSTENAAQIRWLIKNSQMLGSVINEILSCLSSCDEIQQWGEDLLADQDIFKTEQLDFYLRNNQLSLLYLEMLLLFLKNNVAGSQEFAVALLNYVSNKNTISVLSENHFMVSSLLVRCVGYLDNNYIKIEHLIFLKKMFSSYGARLLYDNDYLDVSNLCFWNEECLQMYVEGILHSLNLNAVIDSGDVYYVSRLFDKIDNLDKCDNQNNAIFQGTCQCAQSALLQDNYGAITAMSNLDNLSNLLYADWNFLIQKLQRYFALLNMKKQESHVQLLLSSDLAGLRKIGLYLLRKNNLDLDILCKYGEKCFSCNFCICELFLCLRDSDESLDAKRKLFYKPIQEADFGWDVGADTPFILKIKNSFFKILGDDIQEEKCYDIIGAAENNDNVYSVQDVKYELQIDKLMAPDWAAYVKKELRKVDKYVIPNYTELIVRAWQNISDDDFAIKLKEVKTLEIEVINYIVISFQSQYDKFSRLKQGLIQEFCLNIITEANVNDYQKQEGDSFLLKHCFWLLSRHELEESVLNKEDVVQNVWVKFKNVNLDKNRISIEKDCRKLIDKIINNADFDKFAFFANYAYCRYINKKKSISDFEKEDILSLIVDDSSRIIAAYLFNILCVALQNDVDRSVLYNKITGGGKNFSIQAYLLIIFKRSSINDTLIETCKRENVLAMINDEIEDDRYIVERFYQFIVGAIYFDKITIEDIKLQFNNIHFVESLIRTVSGYGGKIDRAIQKVLIPAWGEIRNHLDDVSYKDIAPSLSFILSRVKEVPPELIKLMTDVLEKCEDNSIFLNYKVNDVIHFYQVNKDFVKNLIELTVMKQYYVNFDELKLLMSFFKDNDIKFGENVLLKLLNVQKITLRQYNELYRILEES